MDGRFARLNRSTTCHPNHIVTHCTAVPSYARAPWTLHFSQTAPLPHSNFFHRLVSHLSLSNRHPGTIPARCLSSACALSLCSPRSLPTRPTLHLSRTKRLSSHRSFHYLSRLRPFTGASDNDCRNLHICMPTALRDCAQVESATTAIHPCVAGRSTRSLPSPKE